MSEVLDLLHAEPRRRLRPEPIGNLLAFAFATGGGTEEWEKARAARDLEQSEFDADCFSHALSTATFVDRLGFAIGGRYRRPQRKCILQILQTPPIDRASVELRYQILGELQESRELREAVELLWQRIEAIEQALLSKHLGQRLSVIHRRVEILRHFIKAVDALGAPFAEAHSALNRLAQWRETLCATPAYHNLCQVLEHEDHLATIELNVRIGYDGEIRRLSIVRLGENTGNEHHRQPWTRFLSRLRCWFRGYVLREAEIVGRLVESMFESVQPALLALIDLLPDLEWYLCALNFRTRVQAAKLKVCTPEWLSDVNEPTSLSGLFNPFLLNPEHSPVPCDLAIPGEQLVILTGPNSGGKTRLLQAIGMAQLLAQAGFFVPAARARLVWRHGLFVSAYEEASVDQQEGRLGTELVRIRGLFERIDRQQLVIMDELCSGTNPAEAEALIRLVLELLGQFAPQAFITTHFLEFARSLSQQSAFERLTFLQALLDARNKPTYQFGPGVATSSLAAETAERLGVTREALQATIARRLGCT